MNMEYKDIHNFKCEELERLFLSVEWSSGHYPDKLAIAMKNYETVYSAWDDDNERQQIDSERKCCRNIKYKWLNVSIHFGHWEKSKSNNNSQIDIHQKQEGLSLPVYPFLLNPYGNSYH